MKTAAGCLVVLVDVFSGIAFGADAIWTNRPSGDWYEAGNWSPASVPTWSDDAILTNGATASIAAAGNTARAGNVYLGRLAGGASSGNGLITISAGTLSVSNSIQTGYPYSGKYGVMTQDGGTVVVSNTIELGAANSRYRLNAGTLTVGTNLVVGTSYETSYFDHNAGDVLVGQDLNLGGQGGNNAYTMSNGTLTIARDFNATIGGATFNLYRGTVTVGRTFNAGATATFTINLYTARVSALNLYVGDRYSAQTRTLQHLGADVTVSNQMSVCGLGVKYALREGTLALGKGGQLGIGGGDAYGAGKGEFLFNISATGATELKEVGTGSGAGLKLRDYYTGHGMGRVGDCVGTFRGWGVVGFSGTLNNSGIVIADGEGQQRTLDLSSFGAVANTFDNTTNNGALNTGWFATKGGKLVLPPVTNVTAGNGAYNWGEAPADSTPDLINSARLVFTNVTTAGGFSMALLATNREEVVLRTSKVIGLWQGSLSNVVFSAGGGITITFRYDDLAAASNGVDEASLRLWQYSGIWRDITASIDTNLNAKWIASRQVNALSLIAVSPEIPYPLPLGTVISIRKMEPGGEVAV